VSGEVETDFAIADAPLWEEAKLRDLDFQGGNISIIRARVLAL
jgi:hypothetical protein